MRQFQVLMASSLLIIISLPAAADGAKLGTWNLEWLTVNSHNRVDEGKRTSDDFEALNQYFKQLDADIIAFQEVDTREAFERISSPDYTVILSDRSSSQYKNHQFSDINQFTGFAIRNSVPFSDPKDIDLYGKTNHKLRFASYVVLYPESKTPIHALSLHLKAGCMGKYYSSKDSCQTLLDQGNKLNQWIQQREKLGQEYIIMGDFNHNLSYKGDWLWKSFTRNLNKEPVLATKNTPANCKVRRQNKPSQLHQYRSLIDHIIVSRRITAKHTQQLVYKPQDVLSYHLSDHCPVNSQLSW